MAGVLLDQVQQDAFECCRLGVRPAWAGLSAVGQPVFANDRAGAGRLKVQVVDEIERALVVGDEPETVAGVGGCSTRSPAKPHTIQR